MTSASVAKFAQWPARTARSITIVRLAKLSNAICAGVIQNVLRPVQLALLFIADYLIGAGNKTECFDSNPIKIPITGANR